MYCLFICKKSYINKLLLICCYWSIFYVPFSISHYSDYVFSQKTQFLFHQSPTYCISEIGRLCYRLVIYKFFHLSFLIQNVNFQKVICIIQNYDELFSILVLFFWKYGNKIYWPKSFENVFLLFLEAYLHFCQ